tara:strand:+ start:237 stop:551 length:315 start_codon:yes stop_codon:yes gene_type:complete
MKYKDTQIIECPNEESFKLHIKALGEMIHIAEKNHLRLNVKIWDKEKFQFEMIVGMNDRKDQKNAMVELIQYFTRAGIEPGKVISSDFVSKPIKQTLEILENVS